MSITHGKTFADRLAACVLCVAAVSPLGASAAQPALKATCSAPDHLATFDETYNPNYPALASALGLRGTAVVRIALARTGRLKSAAIAHSSGHRQLDEAALEAARASTFRPETVACQGVEGEYLIEVGFDQ